MPELFSFLERLGECFRTMSFDAFITIMLTAIGVMVAILGVVLGALAVGLGVAALWGYNGMIEQASKVAEKAAGEVSLARIMEKAELAAKKTAQETILANKDKWLEQLALGVELSAAQSEVTISSSNIAEAVSPPYPGEGKENGDGNNDDNAGPDNPPAPNNVPR